MRAGGEGDRPAGLEQESRITTVAPPRPERHRQAPRRRLEYRVQAGPPEPAADVGHGSSAIDSAQHADPIDEEKVPGPVARLRRAGAGALPEALRPLLDAEGALRCWPHRHGMDGFFAVRMEQSA